MTSFEERIWEKCKRIPKGRVSTYKALAKAVGSPAAFRAAGKALNKNPFPVKVPCHRVVKSDGSLGGFAQGERKKIALLKKEGIKVKGNKVKGFKEKMFCFHS